MDQVKQNRINRIEANQLFNPDWKLDEHDLRQVLKWISMKNLKRLVNRKGIGKIFNVLSKYGKISSLKCFKYVIANYKAIYKINSTRIHTSLLYSTLKHNSIVHAKYLMKKYNDIDYVEVLYRFDLDENQYISNYLKQRLNISYSNDLELKINQSKDVGQEKPNEQIRSAEVKEEEREEFNVQEIMLSFIAIVLVFQIITLAIILFSKDSL